MVIFLKRKTLICAVFSVLVFLPGFLPVNFHQVSASENKTPKTKTTYLS